jgi:hypothetical protein
MKLYIERQPHYYLACKASGGIYGQMRESARDSLCSELAFARASLLSHDLVRSFLVFAPAAPPLISHWANLAAPLLDEKLCARVLSVRRPQQKFRRGNFCVRPAPLNIY